ncbi:hypothetical protein Tco_0633764, partial [Tanacetum coccineum]
VLFLWDPFLKGLSSSQCASYFAWPFDGSSLWSSVLPPIRLISGSNAD